MYPPNIASPIIIGNKHKTTLVKLSTNSGVLKIIDSPIFENGTIIQNIELVNITHNDNLFLFLNNPYRLFAITSIKNAVPTLVNLDMGSKGGPPTYVGMESRLNNAN